MAYGSGGLLVLKNILLDGRIRISVPVFRKSSITGVVCGMISWVPYICFFRDAVGPDFILMDYNAHPDRPHLVE